MATITAKPSKQVDPQNPKPGTGNIKPAKGNAQPTTCNTQPATRNSNPATRDTQPATRNTQLATRNAQPATRNAQPETRNPQYATRNTQPETRNTQYATRNPQPATRNPQPAPRNPHPATRNPQPEARNSQPATRNPKLATRNPQPATRNSQPVYSLNLGLIDYQKAWALQQKLVAARVEGHIDHDILLFLEHPAVFTLGHRGGLDNLLVSEAFFKDSGIPVIQVERGGVITYHGPGQLVVYPIMNLHTRRTGVKDFVAAMEEAMIQTAGNWNINAERNPINSGIWVGRQKMGSIGIALRKGVSFHGLALNVNLDLTPFSWIQPCGLQGVSMTSMKNELDRDLPLNEVLGVLKDKLATALGISYKKYRLSDLEHQMGD